MAPPHAPRATLLEKVQFTSRVEPLLNSPAPGALVAPLATVTFVIPNWTAEFTNKTRKTPCPSRTTLCPVPSSVTFWVTTNVLVSRMVPSQAKLIIPPAARAVRTPASSHEVIVAGYTKLGNARRTAHSQI